MTQKTVKYKIVPEQDYPPHWCKYCHYFGTRGVWNVCYHGHNIVRLLLTGPRIVEIDETCQYFKYAKKYKNQKSR